VVLDIYFFKIKRGNPIMAKITREACIVEDLRVNILININILGPEKIIADF
jgi:hypothetical protein